MATETVDNTWLEAFDYESRAEYSDITSRDILEDADDRPLRYRLVWPKGEGFVWSFAKSKKIASVEEAEDLEEAPSTAHAFFKLSILLENYSRFLKTSATGVISGHIPEPKIDVLVRVARDVIGKSKANGSWGELETTIELAKATYNSLKKIELILEKDPEIQDWETLRFIFTVSGNPEQILEEENGFRKQIKHTIRQDLCEKVTITYYWK
jgi:hypothetical protein